jgi:hypothetical protein
MLLDDAGGPDLYGTFHGIAIVGRRPIPACLKLLRNLWIILPKRLTIRI